MTILSGVSMGIAIVALLFSFLNYVARNRPFLGVKSLRVSCPGHNGEREMAVELENVGKMPALGVTLKVSDSGELIHHPDFFLGVIFPGQSASIKFKVPEEFTYAPDAKQSHFTPVSPTEGQPLGSQEKAEEYMQHYPEGHEATMVTCHISYGEPLILGFIPGRSFQTVQPFHVEHNGKAQPARSIQAKVS